MRNPLRAQKRASAGGFSGCGSVAQVSGLRRELKSILPTFLAGLVYTSSLLTAPLDMEIRNEADMLLSI